MKKPNKRKRFAIETPSVDGNTHNFKPKTSARIHKVFGVKWIVSGKTNQEKMNRFYLVMFIMALAEILLALILMQLIL